MCQSGKIIGAQEKDFDRLSGSETLARYRKKEETWGAGVTEG